MPAPTVPQPSSKAEELHILRAFKAEKAAIEKLVGGREGEKGEVPRWWRSEKSWLRDEQKGQEVKRGKEDDEVEEIDIDEQEDEGGDVDGEEDEEMGEEKKEEEGLLERRKRKGERILFNVPIRSKGRATRYGRRDTEGNKKRRRIQRTRNETMRSILTVMPVINP